MRASSKVFAARRRFGLFGDGSFLRQAKIAIIICFLVLFIGIVPAYMAAAVSPLNKLMARSIYPRYRGFRFHEASPA